MKRALVLLLTALVLMVIIYPVTSYAEETGYPFAVEILLPENNIGQMGYYHVPGIPGETIVLQAKIDNLTDEALEISVIPLNAYSGLDGISYQSPVNVDSEVFALADDRYGLAPYIDTAAALNMVPNESKTINIAVHVPDIDAGTLLGGIRFAVFAGTQEVQNAEVDSSTILIDEYLAVDTAIQIDLPGTAEPSVTAGTPSLYDKGICIPIVNEAALIQEDVSATYQIKDVKDAVLIEGSAVLPKMAPVTAAHIFAPWDAAWGKGTYTLLMQINADDQTFDYEQPFTIGEEAITHMVESQQNTVHVQATAPASGIAAAAEQSSAADTQKTMIIGLVTGIPVVFIVIFLWIRIVKRINAKRAQVRQLAGRRYVPY